MSIAIRLLSVLFALLAAPALAAPAPLHPALWHVRGPKGEAWLFGSLHILPPDVEWRTPAIAAAMKAADVFVFEAPLDDPAEQQRLQALVAQQGFLPPGQTLHSLVSSKARGELDAAIAASHLAPEAVDRERPWLAALQLTVARLAQDNFGAENGVDKAVMAYAAGAAKPERYFETLEQQFALFAPSDPKLEIDEFESDIGEIGHLEDEIGPLLDAWGQGDAARIDNLINGEMDDHPEARAALLDDRNKRWLTQIRDMLGEKRRFFITVGAGHLVGPAGVPALLRQAGYRVDGP